MFHRKVEPSEECKRHDVLKHKVRQKADGSLQCDSTLSAAWNLRTHHCANSATSKTWVVMTFNVRSLQFVSLSLHHCHCVLCLLGCDSWNLFSYGFGESNATKHNCWNTIHKNIFCSLAHWQTTILLHVTCFTAASNCSTVPVSQGHAQSCWSECAVMHWSSVCSSQIVMLFTNRDSVKSKQMCCPPSLSSHPTMLNNWLITFFPCGSAASRLHCHKHQHVTSSQLVAQETRRHVVWWPSCQLFGLCEQTLCFVPHLQKHAPNFTLWMQLQRGLKWLCRRLHVNWQNTCIWRNI